MGIYAVLTLLLGITAFYAFLAIYILVHVLTPRTPSLAKVRNDQSQESLQDESCNEDSRRLW